MNAFFNFSFYYSMVSCTLFMCFLFGKFFCVSFIEKFYDRITEQFDGVLIGFLYTTFIIHILYIIVYFTDIKLLKVTILFFGTMLEIITLCCLVLHIVLVYIVPGLQNIHNNIKYKKMGGI